jgi:hypothetical protein
MTIERCTTVYNKMIKTQMLSGYVYNATHHMILLMGSMKTGKVYDVRNKDSG